MPLAVTYPNSNPPVAATPYPFATGYADVAGVQDAVNAATWDSTKANAYPPTATVNRWLTHATAVINAAIAARGYFVPVRVAGGYAVPTGEPTMNGMSASLYLHLEKIAIAYAVAQLHQSRAAAGLSDEKQAQEWMKEFDDYLTRLETGADNLTAWGADGSFPPQIDPAKGFDSGNLGVMKSDGSYVPDDNNEGPWFWKAMEGGW